MKKKNLVKKDPFSRGYYVLRDCYLQESKDLSGDSYFVQKDTLLESLKFDGPWCMVQKKGREWYVKSKNVYFLMMAKTE